MPETGSAMTSMRQRPRGSRARAFAEPYTFAKVHTAGLWDDAGFCEECDAAYCYAHWHDDKVGQFRCPRGHWKSLDPHWSPD
jgi:hypothetical protein